MTAEDDSSVDRAVLAYLENHPSAADTLEGITTWYLEQLRIQCGIEVVTSAIERLIRSGDVERFARRTDATPLFRLTSSHTERTPER